MEPNPCSITNNADSVRQAEGSNASSMSFLRTRRSALKRAQHDISRELRNARRRRARLIEKAKKLTDSELLCVISGRAAADVQKKKAKAPGS